MNQQSALLDTRRDPAPEFRWPEGEGQIPSWIYTDQRILEREEEMIFRGPTWSFVGVEAEVAKPGDYIKSYVGSVPVIVTRDAAGLHVIENRCAHRGVEFCRNYRGNTKLFVCPYHQWTYELDGALKAVPFSRGVKGQDGMPASFKFEEHGLRRLRVASRGGLVFASFSDEVEPLEAYLAPEVTDVYDKIFPGKPLTVLGQHRNTLAANWKLYLENLKDPYHATLLHTYFTTFGLFVAGNETIFDFDGSGRHHAQTTAKTSERPKANEFNAEIRSFQEHMPLHDPSVLNYVEEVDAKWTGVAITIWPNLTIIRNMNILQVRQIVPRGPNECKIVWTVLGYEDDSEALKKHRLRQNNIFGPAGFVGVDDHEALNFLQDGLRHATHADGVALLGGDQRKTRTPITEAAIRALYRHYRTAMNL